MGDVFFWGRRGSGKTARAVFELLLDWYSGNQIWTNTSLHPAFDINYITKQKGNLKIVDAVDLIQLLVENDNQLPNDHVSKTLLLDEIKTQANARNFGGFVNKHLANFVSQARKRNFRLLYTDQILNAYDKWIRLMTEKIVRCTPYYLSNGMFVTDASSATDYGLGNRQYPEPMYFDYKEFDLTEDDLESEPVSYSISRKTMRNIYQLYDTGQMITPVELKENAS